MCEPAVRMRSHHLCSYELSMAALHKSQAGISQSSSGYQGDIISMSLNIYKCSASVKPNFVKITLFDILVDSS